MAKTDDDKIVKVEDRSNGQVITTQSPSTSTTAARRRVKPRSGWTSWLVANLSRLAIWYTIITVLFRCPSDPKLLSPDDSRICRPYLNIKSHIEPFIGPYYHQYASPYVKKAKPYIDTANTRLIRPATVLAVQNYQVYAAPQLTEVQAYAQSQWEKNALPQLRKAQDTAQQVYDENLAVYVQKASEAATPLYQSARDNALHAHEKHIIPAIAYSQPHMQRAYYTFQKVVLEKGVPFVRHAWTNLVIFFDGTLWPFVKKIYTDNVQPQLVMIGERIAKYQESRKLQSAVDQVDASSTTGMTTSATTTTEPTTTSAETALSTSSTTRTSTSSYPTSSQLPQVATDDTITEDLVKWQKKFAVAADTGSDDLMERIEGIVNSMLKNDLGEGQGLATALEKTAEVEFDLVKAKVKSVVSLLPTDAKASEIAAAETEINQSIRKAGNKIKERAKAVRAWSDTFQQALKQRAELASESTLQVLDGIRDLGLQEIGMRWAWMEGVTYKHWQKYHDLKKTFAQWTSEIKETALSNPALTDARNQVEKLLGESMAFTEETAKELVRLRDVAKWKISMRDATDDFDTRSVTVVAAAASAASSFAADVKDMTSVFASSSQGNIESLASAASSSAEGASKSASSGVADKTGTAESLASAAASAATELSGRASSIILGTTGTLESLASQASISASLGFSEASAAAEDAASSASSVVVGSSTGSIESFTSSLSDAATSALSSATSSASSLASSATAPPSEGVLSSASSFVDSISYSASSAVADAGVSSKLKKAADEAGEKVADITSSWSSGS